MANPYSVLGVSKEADEKAIKSAFRKLAKQYHPDQNKDDKNAQAKFAEVNQAYEILGDKKKRAAFDRGEIDDKGKEKFQGFSGGGDPFSQFRQRGAAGPGGQPFEGGFGGAEDIINDLFGSAFGNPGSRRGFGGQHPGAASQRGPSLDIELSTVIGIQELMRGKAFVAMPNGKRVSISVPPEAEDGQVIRLKGQGKAMRGRATGDALVKLKVRPDNKFARQGADLRVDQPIDLETAVLGGKVAVETPEGKLSLKIPAGTNSGKIFRLKGKGLPKKGDSFGDLLVSILVDLDDETFKNLKNFFNDK